VLSDFQISVPELGTIKASTTDRAADQQQHPRAIRGAQAALSIHSHRYPNLDAELKIINLKVPGLPPRLAHQAVEMVQRLRGRWIQKHPASLRQSTGRAHWLS